MEQQRLTGYQAALDYLFARTTGKWRFGLQRVEALLALLGDPHRGLTCFHVGGTNGKGSVCATLEAVLRARGLKVAKYTSPHLVDFRERFLVNGVPLEEGDVVEFIDRWTPEIERLGVTFFEATTAMAFELFARAGVDVAVIEVGLGGRLDASNVVHPLAAGVTSIGLDHTEYLGDTVEEIAFEKAGIFKRGVPAIIGERDARIAGLLEGHARTARAAPVIRARRWWARTRRGTPRPRSRSSTRPATRGRPARSTSTRRRSIACRSPVASTARGAGSSTSRTTPTARR